MQLKEKFESPLEADLFFTNLERLQSFYAMTAIKSNSKKIPAEKSFEAIRQEIRRRAMTADRNVINAVEV